MALERQPDEPGVSVGEHLIERRRPVGGGGVVPVAVALNALLDEHIGHVATRIRELRQLEKQLKTLRAASHMVQSGQESSGSGEPSCSKR